MGGGAAKPEKQHFVVDNVNDPKNMKNKMENGVIMLGSTAKGSLILHFTPGQLKSIKATVNIPKYAHAFISGQFGYLTGGVQELLSTSAELKSIQEQQYQGVISKKFYKVTLSKLLQNPNLSFESLPEMINSRYAHCAVEINENIYVFGGREYGDDETGILSACEKYSQKNKKWVTLPNLQYPRAGASAIIYGEHIYIFGGYTGKNQRSRVIESFHDGDVGWRKVQYQLHEGIEGMLFMPNPNNSASVLIFGGKTNTRKINSVVEINFDKSTVHTMKPILQQRCFHKGFIEGKTVHLIGGGVDFIQSYDITTQSSVIDQELTYFQHCSNKQLAALSCLLPQIKLSHKKRPYQSPKYQNKAFIFGHSEQSFQKIIDLDTFVVISQSQNLNHNFYKFPCIAKANKQTCFILGGISSDLTAVTDTAYSFNLQNQQIKYLQPMKTAKYGFSAVVLGSYLYVIGGRKIGGDDVAILNSCQRFSFENQRWENIASLKYKRHSALTLAVKGCLLAIGGYKGNGVRSNQIQIFVPHQNKWVQSEQKFDLAVEAMTPVVFGNDTYLFGGRAQQTDIKKVFKINVNVDESKKYEKGVKVGLEAVGNLSVAGTNLKVYVNKIKGLAYIFGNVKYGIDVYDFKKQKVIQTEKIAVFQLLKDQLFQSYLVVL